VGVDVDQAELEHVFAKYEGPVLLYKGRGHWSAFPIVVGPGTNADAADGERPRRYRARY